MARSERESDGEAEPYVPPDFDEDAYIHREVVEFKTTVIRTVVAIVAAAAAWAVFLLLHADTKNGWLAGLGICLLFGLALKPVFARFADVSIYRRMDWVGHALMFFFTWLALFTIAVNPPVTDISPPDVQAIAEPPIQTVNGTVQVDLLAVDNAGTPTPTVSLTRDGQALPTPIVYPGDGAGHWRVTVQGTDLVPGHYVATVSAKDARGHESTAAATFNVTFDPLLHVNAPASGVLAGTDEVLVTAADAKTMAPCSTTQGPPCLRTVYFDMGGGATVPFEYSDAKGGWLATAKFDRWRDGNNTGHIAAEFLGVAQGTSSVKGGTILLPNPMTLTVHPSSDHHTVSVMPTQGPTATPVPGPGVVALVGVLAVGALVALRRRSRAA